MSAPKKYVGIVCPFSWGESTFMVSRLREFIQKTGREVWIYATADPAYRAADFERDSQIIDHSMMSFAAFAKGAEHIIFFSISNREQIETAFDKRCRLSLVLLWRQFHARDLPVLSLFDNVLVPHREAPSCFRDSVFGHYAELDWGTNAPFSEREFSVKRHHISIVHTDSNKGPDASIILSICQQLLRILPLLRLNLITVKRSWRSDQKRDINRLAADYGGRFSFTHRCSRSYYLDQLSHSSMTLWPTFAADSASVIYDILACSSRPVIYDLPMFSKIDSPEILRIPCLVEDPTKSLLAIRPIDSCEIAGRFVECVRTHYNKPVSSEFFDQATYRTLTQARQEFEGYWLGNLHEVAQSKHKE